MFMLAPFTSGASLLLLLGTATVAAGVQAYGSYREAQVAGAAEISSVRPGTELVTPGTAEHARLNAEADLMAFGLAVLTLGAEAFAAWWAGAQARRLRTEERVRMSHGTDQSGYQGLRSLDEGRIDVAHAAGGHQDLGQGSTWPWTRRQPGIYGFRRGQQRGGGLQHVQSSRFRPRTSASSWTSGGAETSGASGSRSSTSGRRSRVLDRCRASKQTAPCSPAPLSSGA